MIRYATIGTGWITDAFIRGASMVPELQLAAVYSRTEKGAIQFASKYAGEIQLFTYLTSMAACPDIDAVYIASPNSLHYSQSKLFLEHGKHVICEKPAVVLPGEMRVLQHIAKERGLIYMEAIMMMHLPARRVLHDAVKKLGRIYSARIDFSQLSSKYPSLLEGGLPNIFNPAFATGALMDLGIYCVYPVIDLFGMPVSLRADALFLPTGADGVGNCLFIYQDKHINISYSKVGQDRIGSEIIGDAGTLRIQSISQLGGIALVQKDGTEIPIWGHDEKDVLMSGEAQDFARYILNFDSSREEYEAASALSLDVSLVMDEIRNSAGIQFPLDCP